jgi:hypothetical protein
MIKETLISLLPSITSPVGIAFYGLIIYIFSFIFAHFGSLLVNKHINFEESLHKRYVQQRNEKEKRLQKLVNYFK